MLQVLTLPFWHMQNSLIMRSSRLKQYSDGVLIEEERTHKKFLSSGYLLHGGVVGMARPLSWAFVVALLLISHRCWNMR
jgi:hypothetical protein